MHKTGRKKLLYIVNSSNYFLSHRSDIALSAMEQGFQIYVASPNDDEKRKLEQKGFIHQEISLSRSGKQVFKELKTLLNIFKIIKRIKPDLVHLITIKPVIYGGIVSSLLKVKGAVLAVPGLGYSYIATGIRASIFRLFLAILYKMAFKKNNIKVVFQNEEDKKIISKASGLNKDKIALIKGSGVDLDKYSFKPIPKGRPIISMASRLQKDKGVTEYYEAAKILKEKGVEADFYFIGSLDSNYANEIEKKELMEWKKSNVVNFLGYRDDINILFHKSTIIVLPSYREGFPKVLQEAAASGRPVITSDVPGCRDAVKNGLTGLLINPRDSKVLAEKILFLLGNKSLLKKMGVEARKLAEREFSSNKVVKEHLKIYKDLLK